MNPDKNIKKKAMEIFINSYHGLTFDEWCGKLKEKYQNVDKEIIQKEVTWLIKNNWKVQYLEDKKRGRIYVYLDLLL